MEKECSLIKTKSHEIQFINFLSPSDQESLNSSPKLSCARNSLNLPVSLQHSEFESRALSFLKGISTASPHLLHTKSNHESLALVHCTQSAVPLLPITSEEVHELNKVQAWIVTSGAIKKSYSHCLLSSNYYSKAHWEPIRLHIYPGKIPNHKKHQKNLEFNSRYPELDPRLKLSMIVNLRDSFIEKLCGDGEIDPGIVSLGLSCFEKLLNLNLVNKCNRKLYAAVCVVLAYKFLAETHLKENRIKQETLMKRLKHLSSDDLLTSEHIFQAEFSVYSYLNFTLHLKTEDINDTYSYVLSNLTI